MNSETKQQLYGGEISDYYKQNDKITSPESDHKKLSDLYAQICMQNNPLNLTHSFKNKIKILK